MTCLETVELVISVLSAIGTFGAAIIALYLVIQGNRQRIDCVFMWERATNDKPMLILNNIGTRTAVVERVKLCFCGQEIGNIDVLRKAEYKDAVIISPSQECRIVLDVNSITINTAEKPKKNSNTLYKLTAIVQTTNKKKYKSSYRYTYDELEGLYFVAGFNDE